jgi:uncharacterized Zn finger protein
VTDEIPEQPFDPLDSQSPVASPGSDPRALLPNELSEMPHDEISRAAAKFIAAGPAGRASSMPLPPTSSVVRTWFQDALLLFGPDTKESKRPKVLAIDVSRGRALAQVRFQRRGVVTAEVEITPLSEEAWAAITSIFADQTLIVARLLAGDLPERFVEICRERGISLFPAPGDGFEARCECSETASRCEHRASLLELLAEEIERDPFVLLLLRGKDRSDVLRLLGTEEEPTHVLSEPEPMAAAEPLPTDARAFWSAHERVPLHLGEIKEPEVPAVLVRRLGEFPFWRGARQLLPALERVYRRSSKFAAKLLE